MKESKQPSVSSAPKPEKKSVAAVSLGFEMGVHIFISPSQRSSARFESLCFCWEAAKPGAKVNDTSSKEKDSFIM